MSRNPVKAALYLEKLEDARCEGRWDEIPELVRKIRKHASDRSCITTTAETEFAIVRASQKQQADASSAAAASSPDLDTAQLAPRLLKVIEVGGINPEETYQAQVCLGWLHWTAGEYDVASTQLPTDDQSVQIDQPDKLTEWTRVCALKAAYLKAYCLARNNKTTEALDVDENTVVALSSVWSGQKGRKQLRFWSELLLTQYCMLQAQALERGEKSLEDNNSLAPFRSWSKFWEGNKTQGASPVGGRGFRGSVPRRRVWNEYYAAISGILRQDLPFPTGHLAPVTNDTSARNQLRIEVKKAEAAYEGLLLSETSFPRADEEREEVETFVAAAMRNWSVLIGRDWHEQDLGPGGKEGLSRGVLDSLYRAATKTYQSTAILRHLFTVHLAVAEFDLAFHALKSYMEIVKQGKARVDKTGHPEPSLDDDATVLETISQAITALCKYGFAAEAAEKAQDLGVDLEDMLQKLPPPLPSTGDNISTVDEENGNGVIIHPRVPARIYALSWQAIGLSNANWSRATYDAPSRTELQAKSIRCLQKSLSPETGNPTDVRTLFTLGVVLAEQRELNAAIDLIKAALVSSKTTPEEKLSTGPYWRERSLIPLWHLLALLLSARQDYVLAARACEGAFEQFDNPETLFGSKKLGAFRSEHLNEMEARNEKSQALGLVDGMDDLEKAGIIEVKMTQLALLELLEGPGVAVNASHELLTLFTRLFGSMQTKPPATAKLVMDVPKSSAGTIRSIRGSIFGGKSDKNANNPSRRNTLNSERSATIPERPKTQQSVLSTSTATPTIQITKDNSDVGDPQASSRPTSVRSRRSDSARKNSLKKRDGSAQRRRPASSAGEVYEPSVVDGEAFFTPMEDGKPKVWGTDSDSRGRGLLRFDSTLSSTRGSTFGTDSLVLDSLSSPSQLPSITFPEDQIKRQRQTLLTRVWLMIASFYRRSELYSDAKGAVEEAQKLVEVLKGEVSKDTTGIVSSTNPGWGGRISLEELAADVHAELGLLTLDQGIPYLARAHFEEALMHYPDHLSATVSLSNILLDIYTEKLLPPPSVPSIDEDTLAVDLEPKAAAPVSRQSESILPQTPLGLGSNNNQAAAKSAPGNALSGSSATDALPAPYKARSLPLVDRLAARDRAYGLLSRVTKLGKGWNYSDAWFALARAHEESEQPEKAKEALWWCVELEEGMAIRGWSCVGVNGYVL
ncbi:hypothetical protein F5Y16DRAFT_144946 [Xylariaceae sp. FL0255]|nr:hypothetical protein F5Y16DRAFT_144946 [Xylariaceae sp. FL0255]